MYFDKIFLKKLIFYFPHPPNHIWENHFEKWIFCWVKDHILNKVPFFTKSSKFWYVGWCWHNVAFCWPKNHILTKFIFLMKFCTFWYIGWYWPCVDLVLTFCWLMLTKIICWLNSFSSWNSVHFDILGVIGHVLT